MIEVSLINKVKYYRYQTQSGQIVTSTDNEIWHIPGLSSNGITGLSVLALARKTFGLSIDAEDFGSRFFSNDARPGVVIEHPGTLGDTAYKNLKESVSEEHEGVVNSHKPMILEEGMKLHEIGIPPGDAQFLETRKFEVIEIARWFRVQPHLIGDLERSTNNNIEQQSIEFVVYTMRPWLVRWEQSINKHLLLPSERKTYYVEHLVDGLLRGDTLSRFQAYGVGKQWGFLSTNDIRRAENMNSVSGGDVYMAPLNYTDQINLRDGALNEPQKETNLSDDVEKRLNDSVQILFRDVMSRVIKREVQDLKQLTKKTLANGSNEVKFRAAVVDFYQNHMDWVGKQIFPLFQSFRTLTGSSEQEEARFVSRFCKIYQNKALEEVDIFLRSHEIDPNGFEAFLDEWKESRIKLTIDQKGQIFIGTEES